MAPFNERQYDITLLGATGYTGKLCAEHITTHLPTDLRWAIAGRSSVKLEALVHDLDSYNADRPRPAIEVVTLEPEELDQLSKKSRVVISTIGPYHLYGSPVVEACARNGTHYIDVTGELIWVTNMIQRYQNLAKANGAVIMPQMGIESAPSDLMSWSLATLFRKELSLPTGDVIGTLHNMQSRPSGGTLATVLTTVDAYSLNEMAAANKPWALSPVPGPMSRTPESLITKLFGVRFDAELGVLTTSVFGATNRAIVQRTWGLLDDGNYYGPRFQYHEYMTARNIFHGVVMHFALVLGLLTLVLPPVRWLVKKVVYAPGEGVAKAYTKNEAVEFRAVATADQEVKHSTKSFAKFAWNGGIYHLTGVLAAQAAMVILRDSEIVEKTGGGFLTAAVLGQQYIDRLQAVGVVFETGLLPSQ